MKVFISYSTDDRDLVNQIAKEIEPHAEVHYWDKSKEPGVDAWKSIFGWIDQSDTLLAIITDKTVARGMSVGQEIGHAKTKGKRIIPLVAEGVPSSALGCISGLTRETLSPTNLVPTIERLKRLFAPPKKAEEPSGGLADLILLGVIVGLVWLVCFRKK